MWSHPQVNEEPRNDNSANSPQGYFYQLHKLVSPDPSPYVGHRDVFSTSNEERTGVGEGRARNYRDHLICLFID